VNADYHAGSQQWHDFRQKGRCVLVLECPVASIQKDDIACLQCTKNGEVRAFKRLPDNHRRVHQSQPVALDRWNRGVSRNSYQKLPGGQNRVEFPDPISTYVAGLERAITVYNEIASSALNHSFNQNGSRSDERSCSLSGMPVKFL
jgi:hypothetical protein